MENISATAIKTGLQNIFCFKKLNGEMKNRVTDLITQHDIISLNPLKGRDVNWKHLAIHV